MVSVESFSATILRRNLCLGVEEVVPDPEAVEMASPSPGFTGDGIFEFFPLMSFKNHLNWSTLKQNIIFSPIILNFMFYIYKND